VNDVEDILAHPWFKEINQEALMAKKLPAPFVPKISNPDDTSHFDEKF